MKTITEKLVVERSGVAAEANFSIKATAKSFEILSSGLYSDKILAIVRELSCNAYDSHVAAGKADTPIEIKLPNYLDSTFYVRDYGVGMSHEDVMQLYTTYFESTKTASNDFIGQLGLGSKSPFSYVSTFIVESWFKGIQRTYTCYKDESGLPAIALLNEQETTECNGMKISIAVKKVDTEKFTGAARKALMYFSPAPTIVGDAHFKPYTVSHTAHGSNWKLRMSDHSAYMQGAYVIQGFVSYPINGSLLAEHPMSAQAQALCFVDLDLSVGIGDVEVAASREALSYDKRTVTNLIAAVELAATELRASFQREFDACANHWDAAVLYRRFMSDQKSKLRDIFAKLHDADPFMWNGSPATSTIRVSLATVKDTQLLRVTVGKRKLAVSGSWDPDAVASPAREFEFNLQPNTVVIVDTMIKSTNDRILKMLESMITNSGLKPSALVIRSLDKKRINQTEIDAIIQAFGCPSFTTVDQLPVSAKAGRSGTGRSTYVKRAKEVRLKFVGFPEAKTTRRNRYDVVPPVRRVFSRLTWQETEVDLTAGGYYVLLDRFTPTSPVAVSHVSNLDLIIRDAKLLGLIENDAEVYGFTEKELAHAQQHSSQWRDLFTAVSVRFTRANVNDALFSFVVSHAALDLLDKGFKAGILDNWGKITPLLKDGLFKTTLSSFHALQHPEVVEKAEAVRRHVACFRVSSPDPYTLTASWRSMWESTQARYPLLVYVDKSTYNLDWVAHAVTYINLVDG